MYPELKHVANNSIGVVIPTHRAEVHLSRLLPILAASSLQPRILVIDSSSDDNTLLVAQEYGAETLVIPRNEFNHGSTRELGRKYLNTDIVVMMTQDAYPVGEEMLEHLVLPLLSGEASVSYGRQIPHAGADIFEAFPRAFNYPAVSHIRSIADVENYGVFTFFCSDSCADYVNTALDETGGFSPILTNEDYFAVAKLLQHGYRIAYVAEAVVEHSHGYTLRQEFQRYFDTGYVRAVNPWVTAVVGSAEGRGRAFLRVFLQELAVNKPLLIPYALLNTLVKWLGYRVGFCSLNAPVRLKKMLSGQKHYWTSRAFLDHESR